MSGAIAESGQTMTQQSAVLGTAHYLSPEQARGEVVDARSDIYSAGCVLYELLTGRPPFNGETPVSIAYQHVNEQPKVPSSLDPSIPTTLDAIVLHALSKHPSQRYQTAGEMRADVERAIAGMPINAPTPAPRVEADAPIATPTPVANDDVTSETVPMSGGPARKPAYPIVATAAIAAR